MDYQAIQSICNHHLIVNTFLLFGFENSSNLINKSTPGASFLTASVIGVPILYAWTLLRKKRVGFSDTICDFADERLSKCWLFLFVSTRKLAYNDVLTMMIGLQIIFVLI